MIKLTIDGKEIAVEKGTTVYQAAKQLGIDIPIFCYQDRMPPFGACRMCLVEVEKMPKLQASCTLEATEGMVVKTQSQPAVEGRKGILELLLINHPLDCPICDRGGECPLQENALKHGPGQSRFFEEKRHFKKPIPLGPVLELDRERCIVCARCTRFGDIIAGDHALEFIERGYKTEVGTADGAPADSKYIGNTIMICPVGALTSRVYRFRARPWDNTPTESTCTLCPVGCSMILDSRDGEIMRTRSKEDIDVNDIWLCDKGWFGYEFSAHPDRLKQPLIRKEGKLVPASWDEALGLVATKLWEAKESGQIAGWGGDSLTTEECYLFQKLIREAGGAPHVDHRMGIPMITLEEEGLAPGMEMSIGECEELSYAILYGLDLTEEFPVIWLRLKQAINRGAKVIFIGHYAPEIAPHLSQTILHAPGKEIEMIRQHMPQLEAGKKGALFVGRQYLQTKHRKAIVAELLNIKKGTPNLTLNIMEGHGNSFGARLAGVRPDIGPLGQTLNKPGYNPLQVMEKAMQTGWKFLYVVGANPAVNYPGKMCEGVRPKIGFMVVQDIFLSETANEADVVLPTLSFVEKGGSFVNIEGRVRTLMPGKEAPENVYSDGAIFRMLGTRLHVDMTVDPSFADRLKPGRLPLSRPEQLDASHEPVSSHELAATFAPALFDRGVRMRHNPHVIQLAKEPKIRLHPSEGSKRNIKTGDIIQVKANGSTIKGKVFLDKNVAEGTVVLPLGFEQIPVHELGIQLWNGMPVEGVRS